MPNNDSNGMPLCRTDDNDEHKKPSLIGHRLNHGL